MSGGNPTRSDIEAAELLVRNDAERLGLVRQRASTGLTAFTGLISLVLVGRAPQSLRDIHTSWRILVGVLLALALAAFVLATYRAYQSAYGDPGAAGEVVVAHQPLEGLAERLTTAQRQAANAAQDHLRQAAGATGAGLALLALATGLTWYAPTANTSSPAKTFCLMVNGKPVAKLTGGTAITVQAGATIGPCP